MGWRFGGRGPFVWGWAVMALVEELGEGVEETDDG